MSPTKPWLTAVEALALLQVRPQTLYANVSRGRIRARPDPADPRRSLYRREDVLRMSGRATGRRNAETVAAQAMEWGDPVLPSAISTVIDGHLLYRGQDAVVLAGKASFEDAVGVLWEAEGDEVLAAFARAPGAPRASARDALRMPAAPAALVAALHAMTARSVADLPTLGRALPVLRAEAGDVLATFVDAMLALPASRVPRGSRTSRAHGATSAARPLSERLAQAWGCAAGEDTLRRALVLLADHELNASTFAARVTVSTGAALSAGVLAGLATLTGPLHGGASASLRALLEASARTGPEAAVRDWLAQGRALPGFGHALYPDGDVRAIALLGKRRLRKPHAQLADVVREATGELPNIDFALVTVCETLGLPPDAPFILFAVARCAGWLAHGLEQAQANRLIRPRAKYVGPAPMQAAGARMPASSAAL